MEICVQPLRGMDTVEFYNLSLIIMVTMRPSPILGSCPMILAKLAEEMNCTLIAHLNSNLLDPFIGFQEQRTCCGHPALDYPALHSLSRLASHSISQVG